MLYLKKANLDDIQKEYLFVRDIPADENGFLNDMHGISYDDFAAAGLPQMIGFSEGISLPEGYVPETFYFLWNDDEIVGQFRLRHYLCESLRVGAGHIGYFIKKGKRSLGFGREGLRLLLENAADIIPEDEFFLRVNKDNPASLKIMLHNGGYIEHEDEKKYYVRIPKRHI